MKNIYILMTLSLLSVVKLSGQISTVLTTPETLSIWDFAVDGNDLYYTDFAQNAVFKIDVSEINPTPVLVTNGIINPKGLCLDGNDLYVAGDFDRIIAKINISANLPTNYSIFIDNIEQGPSNIVINGDDFYFCTDDNGTDSKIFKTSKSTPGMPVEIVNGIEIPMGMQIHGDYLYYAELGWGKNLFRIDIANDDYTPVVVAENFDRAACIKIINNTIFIPVREPYSKITTVEIDDNLPITPVDIITDSLVGANTVAVIGNELFIGDYSAGKILKQPIDIVSSVDYPAVQNVRLFPNPVNDFIRVEGLIEKEAFIVYDALGAEVLRGDIYDQETINTKGLATGLYYLKFKNGQPIKFLKQ